jgi:hypothetical protein
MAAAIGIGRAKCGQVSRQSFGSGWSGVSGRAWLQKRNFADVTQRHHANAQRRVKLRSGNSSSSRSSIAIFRRPDELRLTVASLKTARQMLGTEPLEALKD